LSLLSSDFALECAMQLGASASGCVLTQHALGSGEPRQSMHGCACWCVHARTTCSHYPCMTCTNLYGYQVCKLGGSPMVLGSWWIQRWCLRACNVSCLLINQQIAQLLLS